MSQTLPVLWSLQAHVRSQTLLVLWSLQACVMSQTLLLLWSLQAVSRVRPYFYCGHFKPMSRVRPYLYCGNFKPVSRFRPYLYCGHFKPMSWVRSYLYCGHFSPCSHVHLEKAHTMFDLACFSQNFPQCCLWNGCSTCLSEWRWPLLVLLLMKMVERLLFACLLPPQAIDGVTCLRPCARRPCFKLLNLSDLQGQKICYTHDCQRCEYETKIQRSETK